MTSKNTDTRFIITVNGETCVVTRYFGKLPNEEPARGYWGVFELDTGEMVDWNQYINDLKSKYKF